VRSLDFAEGDELRIEQMDDRVGEALRASGVVTAHRVGPDRWEVTPGSKVGVVQVGETTVWIRPKLPIDRIIFLLGYARNPGWLTADVDLAEVGHLVPALAQAFADQAERAVERGLLQGYVEVDDTLTVLRGRLRDQDQLRHRFGIAVPLLVRFDDHTTDIAENRLLRSATEQLLRVPGVSPRVRSRLRALRQTLGEVTPVVRGAPLPTWSPTRLNQRYQVALWLAEMILRGNAVDQMPGSIRLTGFLIDMAKVFEDFVTAALTTELQRIGGRCQAQDSHFLDKGANIAMFPDLVWYLGGEPAAVIDPKYKAEKPSGFPNADLYQLLAYCTALGLTDGHLIYAKGNEPEISHDIRNSGVSIHAHSLDLSQPPADLLDQTRRLAERINSVRKTLTSTVSV
jgi:5-methylcytosine-specific restriction enzyme subunit McrC